MDNTIRTLMHQLMTDRRFRAQAQQAMMYGHTTHKMDALQFASYQTSANLKNASPVELYTLLALFYESTKNEDYNPAKYFDQCEVKKFNGSKSFILHDFQNLGQLGSREWLSVLPWEQLIMILKDIISHNSNPKVFVIPSAKENAHEKVLSRIKRGEYYAPMIWLNIRSDMHEISAEPKLRIPLDPRACNLVIDQEIMQLLQECNLDDVLHHRQRKRVVPIRITNMSVDELHGAVRYRVFL